MRDLYRTVLLIRRFQEQIMAEYPKQEMKTPVHLCIGEEAVPAGVCAALDPEDIVFSYHRNHGTYIAKGGNLKALVDELYRRPTGCTGGRGGSMHIQDMAVNHYGTSAIIGGSIPIAVGVALAVKRQGTGQDVVCFFGDAPWENGTLHECINLAEIWKLPMLFVSLNNGLATETELEVRQPDHRALMEDGLDAEHVYNVTLSKLGQLPTIAEFRVNRWCEHVGPALTRPVGLDPVDIMARKTDDEDRKAIELEVEQAIKEAWE